MKTCSRCKVEKPLSEFYNGSRYADGKQSRCKQCGLEAGRESDARNRERRRERSRAWHAANPEKRRAINVTNRLRRYGLDERSYLDILTRQGGKCAICRVAEPGWRKGRVEPDVWSWHIDHDHNCCPAGGSCGACVRALLCNRCNVVLGQTGEDLNLLAAMIGYLAKQGQVLRIVGSD